MSHSNKHKSLKHSSSTNTKTQKAKNTQQTKTTQQKLKSTMTQIIHKIKKTERRRLLIALIAIALATLSTFNMLRGYPDTNSTKKEYSTTTNEQLDPQFQDRTLNKIIAFKQKIEANIEHMKQEKLRMDKLAKSEEWLELKRDLAILNQQMDHLFPASREESAELGSR